ncbi:hypothetical protein DSO57_1002788 [Entomophthora muscae]|uniref:Uncharacterized protein n=1 Tax=Entomophthora muscae TaxID=34485 RepID=A0ACC2RNP8_9FUNG|nr:hypothetical protein DSO57_1002788 [Entomophthora muscae]
MSLAVHKGFCPGFDSDSVFGDLEASKLSFLTIRYNHQGPWIFSTPKLFRGKFNYLLAYNIYMVLPVTPKLIPASSPDLPTDHTSKLFDIVYITLTGVVDTIVLAAVLWSWVGKSASYLLKLAPLLWWALPAKTPAQVIPKTGGPAAQDWIPDNGPLLMEVAVSCCTSILIKFISPYSLILP